MEYEELCYILKIDHLYRAKVRDLLMWQSSEKHSFIDADLLVYLLQGLTTLTLKYPEERLSFQVRNYLVEMSAAGKLKATWAGIPNEIPNQRNPAFGRKLKAQGKLAGCTDYVILAPPGLTSFWLELKAENGKLSAAQKMFQGWARLVGCQHHVAKSLDAVKGLLKTYNLISVNS